MWGADKWGEMVWAAAPPVTPVPAMEPAGYVLLGFVLIVGGLFWLRRTLSTQ
jgi:hypothetical protein